jgi:hypothetical protein
MKKILCIAILTTLMAAVTQASGVYEVAYRWDFTGTDLASAGLATSAGVNGTWKLDTTNKVIAGQRTGGNPRASVYTTNSWQNADGFTLYITFNQQIAGARYSFGLVTSDYTIASATDSFNAGSTGAYGIGFTACGEKGDSLVFNNGTTSSVLSTAQGANIPGTLESMYITVTPNSWSYSLNGAPATTGSFVTPFDTSKSFRFVAHAQDVDNQYIKSITLTKIPANPVTPAELKASLTNQLAKFPAYSWDKISRWAYGYKANRNFTDQEIAIMGSRCKYIWILAPLYEREKFRATYPNNMYCFPYLNLERNYAPFLPPEQILYKSGGGQYLYGGRDPAYNQANPVVRQWWINNMTQQANAYLDTAKTDVIFVDGLAKALSVAGGDVYDFWGNPISDNYMETSIKPLLTDLLAGLSTNFIIQGNFLRPTSPDSNLSYVSNYIHSSYLEGFEGNNDATYAANLHKGIDAVQQAVRMGKMICPNLGSEKPWVCAELTLEQKRAKASAAMPVFWARLGPTEQDELANMYAYFDFKLAFFLIMAGEHSYLRYSDEVSLTYGGTDIFKIVPPFPEFNRKLGAPLSEGVRINSTTWVREFQNCKVTLNVDAGIADIEWRSQLGVAYQGDFTGADLASAGLATSAGVQGNWTLNTANDWATGTGGGNCRANLYTTQSWEGTGISSEGYTLNVTFKNNIDMVRYSFGIVDAAYAISDSSDWLNSALAGTYGIGFSTAGSGTNGDYLGFNNGSSVSELSSAQGNITLNTPQTMSITVTPNSWSYSLNGAPPTTGSFVTPFDTTKKYRFIAHAQDARYQNISSITLTTIAKPVANNQSPTTPADTAINLVLTASDSDSTDLTYAILAGPAHGSLGTLNPTTGAVTYTPTANYNGTDSFTFTAFDGSLYSTGTVSLTVGTVTPTGFSSWITSTFANGTVPGGQQGPNDDFDKDGISNLIEYAIAGQDPTVPTATVGTFTGNALSFSKRLDATGITYDIESSTLLTAGSWTSQAKPPVVESASAISFTCTPGTPDKNFVRLKVTQSP